MRRSTFTDVPVTYGAVGATQNADLMMYPPKGYRPQENAIRLGSGRERYLSSVQALMTWGVQRGSGIDVTDVESGTGEQYAGVIFDDEGKPTHLQNPDGLEPKFADNGDPYITNGMTAVLKIPVWFFRISAPLRVVYIVDEERRAGFAHGTLAGHPQSGEESFVVEHREDDSVWLVVRSFSRAANGLYRLVAPYTRYKQASFMKKYLRSLHPVSAA